MLGLLSPCQEHRLFCLLSFPSPQYVYSRRRPNTEFPRQRGASCSLLRSEESITSLASYRVSGFKTRSPPSRTILRLNDINLWTRVRVISHDGWSRHVGRNTSSCTWQDPPLLEKEAIEITTTFAVAFVPEYEVSAVQHREMIASGIQVLRTG